MTPKEYQEQADRTVCDQEMARMRLHYPLGYESILIGEKETDPRNVTSVKINHGIIGLMNEVGEISSNWQRCIYYGKLSLDDFKVKTFDEAGDVLWHLAELLNACGLSMEQVMEANIVKLRARYPEKWSAELAAEENRNRSNERRVQEVVEKRHFGSVVQDGHGFGHLETRVPVPEPEAKAALDNAVLRDARRSRKRQEMLDKIQEALAIGDMEKAAQLEIEYHKEFGVEWQDDKVIGKAV